MGRSVLALVLVARLALAQDVVAEDTPLRMYQPPTPEMVGYPNWVLTPDGKAKLDATLERQFSELIALREENRALRVGIEQVSAKPALTWKGAAALVGLGVVLGLAVGIPVAVAVR